MSSARRATLGHLGILLLGIVVGAVGVALWLAVETQPRSRKAVLPVSASIEMRASEGYLTEVLADGLAASQLGAVVQDVRVDTVEGAMIILCTLDLLGNELHAGVTVRGHVESGQLHLEVTEVRLGRLALPVGVIIERLLDARVHDVLASAGIEPTGVVIDEDGITITARRARLERDVRS
jgi:hypothetical protein